MLDLGTSDCLTGVLPTDVVVESRIGEIGLAMVLWTKLTSKHGLSIHLSFLDSSPFAFVVLTDGLPLAIVRLVLLFTHLYYSRRDDCINSPLIYKRAG